MTWLLILSFVFPQAVLAKKQSQRARIHKFVAQAKKAINTSKTMEEFIGKVPPYLQVKHHKYFSKVRKKYKGQKLPKVIGNGPSLYIESNEIRIKSFKPVAIFYNGKKVPRKVLKSLSRLENFVYKHRRKKTTQFSLIPRAHAYWSTIGNILKNITIFVGGWFAEKELDVLWEEDPTTPPQETLPEGLNFSSLAADPNMKNVEELEKECIDYNSLINVAAQPESSIEQIFTPEVKGKLLTAWSKAAIRSMKCKYALSCVEENVSPNYAEFKESCSMLPATNEEDAENEKFTCSEELAGRSEVAEKCIRVVVKLVMPNYFDETKTMFGIPHARRSELQEKLVQTSKEVFGAQGGGEDEDSPPKPKPEGKAVE